MLGRAALDAGVSALARGSSAPRERAGQSGGSPYLLLAIGIATLIALAPGLLIVLMMAGISPGPP